MSSASLAELILLGVCIILAAMASAIETALTSVGRLRVRHLAEEGSKAAATLQRLQRNPNRFLSTVLVVNTIALILASSVTTLLSLQFIPGAGVLADLGVSLVLSVFLLIFAEVTPKTLAIRNAERLALLAATPVDTLASFLRPVLWFITLVARGITGNRAAHGPFLTEEELLTLLHVSEEQGVIEEEEREMIHGIIQIGDKSVREVMVPRTDMDAIEINSGLPEIVALYKEHKHTRMPVFEGDVDHIVGLIHAKDILLFFASQSGRQFEIGRILRKVKFTPEQKKVDELLHQMQTEKVHMMIVVDEYGGTAGLVTLEDLLEEIVGEIRDEYDLAEEDPFRLASPTEAVVDARFPMEELNERLALGIPDSTDYDSVGGYVYAMLGDIPNPGDTFDSGRATWTVEEVSGQRIVRVKITSEEPWPDEELIDFGFTPPERRGPDDLQDGAPVHVQR